MLSGCLEHEVDLLEAQAYDLQDKNSALLSGCLEHQSDLLETLALGFHDEDSREGRTQQVQEGKQPIEPISRQSALWCGNMHVHQ